MVHVQSIFIAFLLFVLCPSLGFTQTSKELTLRKLDGDKEVVFKNNKAVRVVTLDGEVFRGRIGEVNGQTLVFADGTTKVDLNSIVHLRRTTMFRPVASVLATGGTVFFVFGTIGFASSIGSDDTWAQLGAVLGGLIAVSGLIVDAVSVPTLIRTRKFRVSGDKAKWAIVPTD